MNTKKRAILWIAALLLLAILTPGSHAADEGLWHVKAVHPDGWFLDVKAVDKKGKLHAVKAIEESGNLYVLDVKALVAGEKLPLKILVSDDKLAPVKAIGRDGTILDIKALTAGGAILDVKGVKRRGNIIDIRAIGPAGEFYGVKAISPRGQMHDIKGVKMTEHRVETKVSGVAVTAHVKALPQVAGQSAGDKVLWYVKAVHPKGWLLDVQALDQNGKSHHVRAIEESGNLHILDVKALVAGEMLPVKVLVSDNKYAPVKAIGPDGTIFGIKARTAEGASLDVKGIRRHGHIIDIKAIGPDGEFYGVKAISPRGQMHDIKGLKMTQARVEAEINGVAVAAHIKALPQLPRQSPK